MASPPFLYDGLHSPYFIFIRAEGRYSDADLLRRFELTTYQPIEAATRLRRHARLADDDEWTLVADDWYYTLWHMPSTRPAIAELAKSCDVFACSVGDSDHSFDFDYYRDSQLVRRYVVVDPDYRGGQVAENFGEPLPGEASAFQQRGELAIVLSIALSLGITIEHAEEDVRFYGPVASNNS